ncbi:Hsp20/alpha crystallin family protein (plasmid) [Halobaculum sp. CBA1158]|uniref:Hsp20/alpha crystallin family protein n=1 Tax=Halobaculum sp. CBA1158 TaxID=2904243 RepID=UPI001F418ADA|nr:Hsp20/alpha crystallin family protein [Halobaculum sp. CBA1158]UIP01404.1 Hsp20/alpha crystallin family protein [Halobaculum sp. CBA1158]
MATFPFDQESDGPHGVDAAPSQSTGVDPYSSRTAVTTGEQAGVLGPTTAYPDVDIVNGTDEIVAYVDLPGFERDDIRVRIDQQTLVLDAHREGELDESDAVYLRERPTQVERVVHLPAAVRAGGAEAELTDGVCVISLPKAAADRYEEIRIQSD